MLSETASAATIDTRHTRHPRLKTKKGRYIDPPSPAILRDALPRSVPPDRVHVAHVGTTKATWAVRTSAAFSLRS